MQRQYSGTAGRVENCQVAVYLSYASEAGHALIDRELYLPESWVAEPGRCAAAGIPEGTAFATKPQLAPRMITRALDARTPASWVTGGEVYGADPGLRAGLEDRQIRYVLAVANSNPVTTAVGAVRADMLAGRLPPRAWQRLSAGPGAKGHRWYDWAWVAIDPGLPGHHWLLIRRHRRTRERAYYRCYAPRHVPLAALVRAAGPRWAVEEDFQAGKGLAALDEHQVPQLGLLVPVGHPGHARAGLPHHSRAHRTRPPPTPSRDGPAVAQRDRPPSRHPDHPARRRRPPPAALVHLAQASSARRLHLPLPAASSPRSMTVRCR